MNFFPKEEGLCLTKKRGLNRVLLNTALRKAAGTAGKFPIHSSPAEKPAEVFQKGIRQRKKRGDPRFHKDPGSG